MPTPQHTPTHTPWNNKQRSYVIHDAAGTVIATMMGETSHERDEQSAQIISAVNSHAALVAALQDALRVIDTHIPVDTPVCVPGISLKIRAALRSATATE